LEDSSRSLGGPGAAAGHPFLVSNQGRIAMKPLARISFFLIASSVLYTTLSTARAEQWVSIGPFGMPIANHDVIDGQANAIAVDPRDANIIYLGAAEGGVWKTRDGGGSWIPLTDTQLVRRQSSGSMKATMSIGAIAIDPGKPQTVYVGTGDPNPATCCFAGAGLGVFRSADGGSSWVPTGADPNKIGCSNGAIGRSVVNRIVVVPGRQTSVFGATNSGVYRYREDGTDCWVFLMNGIPSGNAIDMVADPYQSALYVGFWSQGVFKSNDLSGNQWQMLAGGLPTSDFGRIALAFGGRTGIGFSQPLPLVYAGFAFSQDVYRLFVTRDGGSNWTELPLPPHDGQLGFNNVITVGPLNSDEVYIGQIAFWQTLDGGRKGDKNDYSQHPPVTNNSWTVLGCCQTLANPFRKGLDLHGDIHDIVFAPYGSFLPDPSHIKIVFVANDGGITKGSFNSDGVVSWLPLSRGLAIGQAGTIGLDPNDSRVSVAGFWHNGDGFTLSGFADSLPFGGGDGFGTRIDAGNFAIYFDCNAGFDGSLCRAHLPAPFFTNFGSELIWKTNAGTKHWADPHRAGHLIRLERGLLFRATGADVAAPAVLLNPDSWVAIDPFWGKTGNTTTMAFRSRVLEEQPVYYLGTSTGQVWRGSPEVGWTKLCECGGAGLRPIFSIAPDLFHNERIFVANGGFSSPGRIKQLTRLGNGTWNVTDIDGSFTPQLSVSQVVSIVVDPTLPETQGTAVYIGTDQGVYRGLLAKPVIAPFAAGVIPPTPFENWTWSRSPGIPSIWVPELQVHQNFQSNDSSGVIRAATYGRGLYELNRALSPPRDPRPIVLGVQAIQIGEDGAPTPLSAEITVILEGKRYQRKAPFEIAPSDGAEVVLEAPVEIKTENAVLAFGGWALPGGRRSSERRIALKMSEALSAVATYKKERSIPNKEAKPLRVVASASARRVCVQNFTHELSVSWEIVDGQRPALARAEIDYPDRHREIFEFKPTEGTQSFPMNYPAGGTVRVKMVAADSTGKPVVAESTVQLEACAK
jgi:hypothetical protein